jgi:hypothetical protein
VLGALGSSIERTLGGLDSLATAFVIIARNTNQSFPFVTIPQYGLQVAKNNQITGSLCTSFMPVISFAQRHQWELYSAGNETNVNSWVDETLALQDNYKHFYGPLPQNKSWESHDTIYGDYGDLPYNVSRSDRLDIHLPGWQEFPLIMINDYPSNWGKYSN